jgi:VCBS repeat
MHRKSRLTLVMMAVLLMVGMVGIQPVKPAQAALPTDLFISEYIEGNSNNKAIEIYNGTGISVDLSDYRLELYSNGASVPSATIVLSGTLATGDVFVAAHPSAASVFLDQADLTSSAVINFNGDDAFALRKISTNSFADVIGQIGIDPGDYWGSNPVQTKDRTLVRKVDICSGDTDGSNAFVPSTEWDAFATDTYAYLGSHTSSCAPEIFPERFIISEYLEGSSNNKAIELYNGTGADINLQNYKIVLFSNGSTTPGNTLTWADELILANGDTYVIANESAIPAILALADITSNITFYNGDDALVLFEITTEGDVVQDSFGQRGVDPGSGWGSGDTFTAEHTLVRKATVCQGDILPDDAFEPSLEYNGFPQDNYANLGSHTMACSGEDLAPTVASTVPADGGMAQKTDDIVITFSEPVTVVDPWFSISCTTSGAHTAVVTDADPVFTLNPDDVFTVGETCTVTIDHTKVNDDDLDDAIADYMLADYVFSFTIAPGCGDPFTPIYDIQGTGETSPLAGTALATEGVVVGDFQVGGKNGYYIQDIAGDGNPATSDGIFVYNTTTAVNVGDHVRVRGTAVEYYGITEISPVTQVWICSTGNTIIPTPVTLPVTAVSDFEKYESMLVTFPQSLIISEYFNFDRYGEIVLTSARHMTPTAFVEPGTPAQAEAVAYLLDRITLDDGRTSQNPDPAIHPNGEIFTMDNLFRGGGTVTNVTGILDFYQGLYRVQPTIGAVYEDINPRTEAPDIIEADLKVTSFNVLNYFVTLDDGTNDICGPSGTMECRGADDAEEFDRQKAKILAALDAIDADIFGLMEIENDSSISNNDAVADLVEGLNAIKGEGTYAYIVTGAIGTDAIKQAILYKPASVTPVGDYQVLDSSVDSRFIDTLNRPVLAQVFVDNEGGVPFVVAVNHLKSKGSACVGDPDLGDGQGNCNLTRKAAAEALVDWLADSEKFAGVEKVLIIGDLNSYDKEDPIDMIKLGADDTADTADDYLDMIFEKRGENAYGYVYDGQTGYLDHALANHAMADSIVDVNFWHINADEPDLIDYDTSFKAPAQDTLYAPDAYRSSDHDPVIVTLNVLTLEEQITSAVDYVYDPVYPYVGLINFDDPNNIFTGNYTDAQFLAGGAMNDLARYLGALYRQEDSSIDTIVFNNVTYTWNPLGELKGSNWEDSSGNTLVSAMVDYFFSTAYDPAVGLQITVSDEVATSTVTFMLINEYAALTWLQMNTVLSSVSGTIADLKATFPSTIPANIVDLPYVIDSRMTLAAQLPAGSTVTVFRDGVQILTDITLSGTGPFWFTELFDPDAPRADFDANYGGAVENYSIVVTGPGGNVLDFDTTVLIESVISKDGYTTETVLDDITLDVNIPADEEAALTWLQENTVLSSESGTIADLTATFPLSIPPVIVAEDYVIDSRMTLAEALPTGSTVTIYREGVAVLTDITLTGVGPFWFTELFTPDPAPRAPFDANYGGAVENYVIVVTGPGNNPLDFDTTVYIESVISKDGYLTETVLDDITLGVHIDDAVAPTITSGVAKSASHGDVQLVDGSFTVNQGYVVDTIEITMTEPVLVELGTIVTMEGYGPYGTITANVDGVITITPYPGNVIAALIGEFTFIVPDGSVTDLAGNAFTGSIILEVLNVAPVAVGDTYATNEDVVLTVAAPGVLINDTDFDPTILTAIKVSDPANGTLVLNADGSFTYTPDADFNGTDTFTYKANDGYDDSNVATVTITVTEIKDQVQAVDDFYTTDEDTTLTVEAPGVLANDIDVDDNLQTASLVTDVQHGSLSLLGDGSFIYIPDPDFHGTDTFVYKLITYPAPQSLWTDEATVTITVNSVDDAPVLSLIEDATIPELVEFSLTASATDVDLPAQVLTFSLVGAPDGAAIDSTTGVFTWTPSEEQGPGVYTFSVKVCDDTDPTPLCDEQEVTLTVTEVNTAPVAQDLTATTPEETSVNVTLMATDVENNSLTYAIVDQPAHGTVTLVGDVATYTPELDFNGEDSFTYKANDGLVDSNVATVTITVTSVNDAPVAVDDEYTVAEKETLTIDAPGVLGNDSDVDGDALSAILVDTVSNGTLTPNANGSFTYIPDEYFNGMDSFTYKASDGELESELAVVTITVIPVNDWPIANDDFYEVVTGTDLVKDAAEGILANDILLDPDEEVSIQILDEPQHGTLSMNDDGSFTYTPNPGYMGTDTFRYLVLSVRTINAEWSDDATVTITVKPLMRLFLPLILR